MPGFILNDGAVVPPSVYSAMNTVLNKKLGTSQVYKPRDWAAIVKDLVPLPIKTASGSIASFNDGAGTVPLKSLIYRLTPTQQGAGDPSPSNPRSINSVSSLDIVHTGKNLVNSDDYYESYKQADGSYISKGSEANAVVIHILPALIGKQVTFSARLRKPEGSTIGAIRVICYVNGVQTNGNNVTGSDYATSSVTFTPVTENDYVKISYGSSGGQNMQYKDVQLELGSTPTTYEPYTSTTHTVDLGGVYGGEGNERGEFTNKYDIVDLSTLNWTLNAGAHRAYCSDLASVIKIPTSGSETPTALAEQFKMVNYSASLQANQMTIYSDGRLIAYYDNDAPAGKLCYELATPTTLAVDPVAISSRYGANNIFADVEGSECEVEYYADPTLSTQ